jgi:uncharacterized protein (DUF488 family)
MIYTIGHSTRPAEEFLSLLEKYSINYLVDVRSRPYSRFNPQYNRERLKTFLEQHAIRYVFMGDTLGGRPDDPSCRTPEGKISHDIIRTKSFFREGITRICTADQKDIRIALMCSEGKPSNCHRSRMIGRALAELNISVQHIDEKGELKSQETVMLEITEKPGSDLFNS